MLLSCESALGATLEPPWLSCLSIPIVSLFGMRAAIEVLKLPPASPRLIRRSFLWSLPPASLSGGRDFPLGDHSGRLAPFVTEFDTSPAASKWLQERSSELKTDSGN